jgi:hypothetical protein
MYSFHLITSIKHIHFPLPFGCRLLLGRQIFTTLRAGKQQITQWFKHNRWLRRTDRASLHHLSCGMDEGFWNNDLKNLFFWPHLVKIDVMSLWIRQAYSIVMKMRCVQIPAYPCATSPCRSVAHLWRGMKFTSAGVLFMLLGFSTWPGVLLASLLGPVLESCVVTGNLTSLAQPFALVNWNSISM